MQPLHQDPPPAAQLVRHAGDILKVRLAVSGEPAGTAWLRTNLGRGAVYRDDLMRHVRDDQPILHHDWHDLPMRRMPDGRYGLDLPLVEVGRFQAKAFWLNPDDDEPLWPPGDNTVIKVEPADTVCANTIYTAFVRQFGPDRAGREPRPEIATAVERLDQDGYTVIPRSGTFRDLGGVLDHIIDTLGFRILQLLPIHPVPTTYARMGRFGSPFATLDYWSVDPALAEFDRRTTPLQQFQELLDLVHLRGAKLFMDMPINHTGWASHLQTHHPEWFARNADASFNSPGAWGVTWEDLSTLDYADRALWRHMAQVFLYWCRLGVDGFRCDAGYMVPLPVWAYITAEVRAQFPHTVFLLEGLGGPAATVERLLDSGNLNWAYSELFQVFDRSGLEAHILASARLSATRGLQIHYAETHDNDRLAAQSTAWAMQRTALCALVSEAGGFGITNGVEWFAAEKLRVHEAAPLAWGNPDNQVPRIARLNRIMQDHPAFRAHAQIWIVAGGDGVLALQRLGPDGGDPLLILVNLDPRHAVTATWPAALLPGDGPVYDGLNGGEVQPAPVGDGRQLPLPPGGACCLTADPRWAACWEKPDAEHHHGVEPARALRQRQRAHVMMLHQAWHGFGHVDADELEAVTDLLTRNPLAAAERLAGDTAPRVVRWAWPHDLTRVVMLPPGHALLIQAPAPFLADIHDDERVWVRARGFALEGDNGHALLLPPQPTPLRIRRLHLGLRLYTPGDIRHADAPLMLLPPLERARGCRQLPADEAVRHGVYAIRTNAIASLVQARADWGTLRSQYDALLAANLNPQYPTDRRVLWTRCRAWLVYRGYSHPLDARCLESFEAPPTGPLIWRFAVPSGLGKRVPLEVDLDLAATRNAVRLRFRRLPASGADHLEDDHTVRLILRPDLEDRGMHEKTKAYRGPETTWPGQVRSAADGCVFTPGGRHALHLHCDHGAFTAAPEWTYMVDHPEERERGLDDCTDLFSPGYFTTKFRGDSQMALIAEVTAPDAAPDPTSDWPRRPPPRREDPSLLTAARAAMRAFVVRRGGGHTVIAGYPWFLDWGRDTMIALRGLIASGERDMATAILCEFARFETQGTLPNLIHGADASNRDTSDAPLWFFTACADLCRIDGDAAFLNCDVGGRSVLEVLESIGRAYREGTPNGIRMDPASGLIFSPSHFTWMDTNFPAGTPREGYPIEIQALWWAALNLLATHRPDDDWAALADTVRQSILAYYPIESGGMRYLADCLHAPPGTAAAGGEADDACRPNQLLALTLGPVTDPALVADVLRACETLLVPGGIRSLADRPVRRPLPVVRDGMLLNDPQRPYWGRYAGDEDTRRKPAYHNGTAWTWLFPSYAEAWFRLGGEPVRGTAQAILGSAAWLLNRDCLGHIPEVLDGNAPHAGRGCGAQAWGCTELYRVLALLDQ